MFCVRNTFASRTPTKSENKVVKGKKLHSQPPRPARKNFLAKWLCNKIARIIRAILHIINRCSSRVKDKLFTYIYKDKLSSRELCSLATYHNPYGSLGSERPTMREPYGFPAFKRLSAPLPNINMPAAPASS